MFSTQRIKIEDIPACWTYVKQDTKKIKVAERSAKKHQRELERQSKELAKMSVLEQTRNEVETHENMIDVLLSVHKEQTTSVDWVSLATSLPPVPPRHKSHNEHKIRQSLAITPSHSDAFIMIAQAKEQDENEYQTALKTYDTDRIRWEGLSALARHILDGDPDAYITAIEKMSPFSELASIGSSLQFKIHNRHLVDVELNTNGRTAIPTEIKTLTASGKVTVKPMPRIRFIEIYQDYICGCALRIARELFALLPLETVLISASASALDTSTGQSTERPFLSVAISRQTLTQLNFELLDPSDSILNMPHRGNLKTSRKTGDFEFITPLTVSDLALCSSSTTPDFDTVVANVKRLRADLAARCAVLNPEPDSNMQITE